MRSVTVWRRMAPLAVAGGLTAGLLVLAGLASPAAAACRTLHPLAAESLFTIWQQAAASGDAKRLGTLYAADAVVYGPTTVLAATTSPGHRRELEALIALGPMAAQTRTVATGCESIRDYGTMAAQGRAARGVDTLRYSRVYELRDGRWLITLEHVSQANAATREVANRSGAGLAEARRIMQRPVPAVAGYLKALPKRDGIGPAVPITVPAPRAVTSAERNGIVSVAALPAVATAQPVPVIATPVSVPPVAKRTSKARPRWMSELPGFDTPK